MTNGQAPDRFRNGLLAWMWMLMSSLGALAQPVSLIVVQAGDRERQESVVHVRLPAGQFPANTWLRDTASRTPMIPLQIDPDGEGWFVVRGMKAGERKTYQIESRLRLAPPSPVVQASRQEGDLRLTVEGRPVFTYHSKPTPLPRAGINPLYQRGGYIHPVLSPSGLRITEDYPTNHVHHHGIWTAWTKTEFQGRHPDFWNMGEGKGRVEPVALDDSWSGPVHAGFRSRHQSVDLQAQPPVVVLKESWTVRLFAMGSGTNQYHVFDLHMKHTAATPDPLKLPEHLYGGLGVRGNALWEGKKGLQVLTALGESDRVKAHATRSPWIYVGGLVDERQTGIAILCHPNNPRAPQPMRVHPDEPFFCYAPVQSGPFEISSSQPYEAHYRFIVFDGEPNPNLLNEMWQDFAYPAVATLEEATTNKIER